MTRTAISTDLYVILEIERSATLEEIKVAYRKKVKQYHPDSNKDDPSAQKKFIRVKHAYEILKDTSKRQNYDLTGSFTSGSRSGGTHRTYETKSKRGAGFKKAKTAYQEYDAHAEYGDADSKWKRDSYDEEEDQFDQFYGGTKAKRGTKGSGAKEDARKKYQQSNFQKERDEEEESRAWWSKIRDDAKGPSYLKTDQKLKEKVNVKNSFEEETSKMTQDEIKEREEFHRAEHSFRFQRVNLEDIGVGAVGASIGVRPGSGPSPMGGGGIGMDVLGSQMMKGRSQMFMEMEAMMRYSSDRAAKDLAARRAREGGQTIGEEPESFRDGVSPGSEKVYHGKARHHGTATSRAYDSHAAKSSKADSSAFWEPFGSSASSQSSEARTDSYAAPPRFHLPGIFSLTMSRIGQFATGEIVTGIGHALASVEEVDNHIKIKINGETIASAKLRKDSKASKELEIYEDDEHKIPIGSVHINYLLGNVPGMRKFYTTYNLYNKSNEMIGSGRSIRIFGEWFTFKNNSRDVASVQRISVPTIFKLLALPFEDRTKKTFSFGVTDRYLNPSIILMAVAAGNFNIT